MFVQEFVRRLLNPHVHFLQCHEKTHKTFYTSLLLPELNFQCVRYNTKKLHLLNIYNFVIKSYSFNMLIFL